ncbi:MAG: hypothetical protein U1A27_08715 [Phycisphaerae bacterium]
MSDVTLRLDRYSRAVLTTLTVLAGVLAVELWNQAPGLCAPAAAQIPDTAMQRKQLIDEARRTNELLAAILDHLRDKPVKVVAATPDKGSDGPRSRR